ncbi:MAG: ABC-F family ATP-binding cassette domain-containing protein, partial [Candidatus Moraniibacteriota bacterium]
MLIAKNIIKDAGTSRILNGVSLAMGTGQKVALVGANGVGKSTLLRILAGTDDVFRGTVQKAKHSGVGYLEQEVVALADETIGEYLLRKAGLQELETLIQKLGKKLDDPIAAEEYAQVSEQYRKRGGYDWEARVGILLEGLGMRGVALDRPVSQLSGGQKSKVNLIATLLRGADILLLDEPTNNLDLPALLWLEAFLLQSSATCLIASHDRAFLDRLVTKVFEIDWFTRIIKVYSGNWSTYAQTKALEERRLKSLYQQQQEEVHRLEKSGKQKMHDSQAAEDNKKPWPDGDKMTRNFKREKAAKKFSAAAQALLSRADQAKVIERPEEREPLELHFDAAVNEEDENARAIDLQDGVAGYYRGEAGEWSLGPISFHITWSDRVAILGKNGSGKSTLFKMLTGKLPLWSGALTFGAGIVLGDFMQEHETLPREWLPMELFSKRAGLEDTTRVALLLHKFHLGYDAMRKKIGEMSPGERARLLLALYDEMKVNTLFLDEPTNHLDVEAIQELEQMLARYAGTVVLVTHDRAFLGRIDRMRSFVLEEGKLDEIGEYQTYADRLTRDAKRLLRRMP